MVVLMHLGLDCSRFGSCFFARKDFRMTPNAGQNPFKTVTIFTFFVSTLLWHMSPQVFVRGLLALILGSWFRKDKHYSHTG